MVISMKLIRKVGKMLRGGAGKKEIFLGAFLGVLLGFNPTLSLTLFLGILITLLLNANIGFTMLGIAVGKILGLLLSHVTFHVGFFIIHSMGLEGLFTKMVNSPVLALMDLNVYSMIGSLPFALIVGIVFGKFMSGTVTKIREQMVKVEQHEKVGKHVTSKFSKFLLWLAFGKQKVSTEDVLAKTSPLFRKSGIILVAVVLVISLLMEFLLMDIFIKKGIQASITKQTGAQVDIEEVHFSMGSGEVKLEKLEVTDPEKPTHNSVQIDRLAADLSMGDLLRRTYTIDLLAGSILKFDVERATPGVAYISEAEKAAQKEKEAAEKEGEEEAGKSLDDYLAKAEKWKQYGEKLHEYLKKANDAYTGEAYAKEKPKASKEEAVAEAKKVGYLKADADLVADRPKLTIRKVEIDNVELSGDYPVQQLTASEITTHPALNKMATTLVMAEQGASEPTTKVVLRFDDPSADHELVANMKDMPLGADAGSDVPLNVKEGKADLSAKGTFSIDTLNVPFTMTVKDLKADVEEGETVMGMDSATATEVFSSMEKIEIDGNIYNSLKSPRVKVDMDKLTANMREALVAAGKKELSKRANKEMDKAKDQAKEAAGKELDKALDSEEGKQLKDKLKSFF